LPTEHSAHVEGIVVSGTAIARIYQYLGQEVIGSTNYVKLSFDFDWQFLLDLA
nr:hypothetical protein [Tanacetum cinerariifolium]